MDDRVRGFERAAGGGDAAAAARVLWERVRRGELDLERVRLAAHVGDPIARLALGEQAPPVSADLRACVRGLEAWGKEAVVRAALGAASSVLFLLPSDAEPWARSAVEAIAAWVRCPCDPHRADVVLITGRLPSIPGHARTALECALNTIGRSTSPTAFARHVTKAADAAQDALTQDGRVDDPTGEVGLAIHEALAGWALGGDDPLARFCAPADPTLWAPPAAPPLPRVLERTTQGDFVLVRAKGARWLALDARGQRRSLAVFSPRAGERVHAFACCAGTGQRVLAWARTSPADATIEVRTTGKVARDLSFSVAGAIEDVAVSPDGQRAVWCASRFDGAPDAPDEVWHLDLRLANPTPARVQVEHAVVRALHFPTHCAIGFITDRAAWDACPPEDRKGALLERHLVRMELLT